MPDHARPLNARGRQAAVAMRAAMQRMGLAPDLVLVSSARRTLQTLERLQPWDEAPEVRPLDALYLAGTGQLLEVIRAVPEARRSVLLIGHNPGLHDLATLLVGPAAMAQPDAVTQRLAQGYPTGALAVFAVPEPWNELDEGGGRLEHFFGPRDLPEMAV